MHNYVKVSRNLEETRNVASGVQFRFAGWRSGRRGIKETREKMEELRIWQRIARWAKPRMAVLLALAIVLGGIAENTFANVNAQTSEGPANEGSPVAGGAGEDTEEEDADGENQDGENQNGEDQDGENQDGENQDGENQDGEGQDGENLDGENQDGESQDGKGQDVEDPDGGEPGDADKQGEDQDEDTDGAGENDGTGDGQGEDEGLGEGTGDGTKKAPGTDGQDEEDAEVSFESPVVQAIWEKYQALPTYAEYEAMTTAEKQAVFYAYMEIQEDTTAAWELVEADLENPDEALRAELFALEEAVWADAEIEELLMESGIYYGIMAVDEPATTQTMTLDEFKENMTVGIYKLNGEKLGAQYENGASFSSRSEQFAIKIDYTILQGKDLKNAQFSFDVEGPITVPNGQTVNFTVMSNDGKTQVASGTLSASGTAGKLTFNITFENAASDADAAYAYLVNTNNSKGIKGNFWAGAQLDATQLANNGAQDVTISVGDKKATVSNAKFPVDPVKPTQTVTKKAGTIVKDTNTIPWTVSTEVSAENLPTDSTVSDHNKTTVTIVDTLPDGLSMKMSGEAADATVETVTWKLGETEISAQNVEMKDATTGEDVTSSTTKVKWTIKDVDLTGTAQTISATYNTTYTDAYIETPANLTDGKASWTNTVDATMTYPTYEADSNGKITYVENGDKTTEKVSANAKAELVVANFSKGNPATDDKSQDGLIKWTVVVESNYKGTILHDTLGNGHYYVVSADKPITLQKLDDNGNTSGEPTKITTLHGDATSAKTADTSSTGIYAWAVNWEGKSDDKDYSTSGKPTEMYVRLGNSGCHYQITYYTKVSDTYNPTEATNLTNSAELFVDTDGTTPPGTNLNMKVQKGEYNPGDSFITKSGTYEPSTQILTWTTTIANSSYFATSKDGVDSFTITDTYSPSGSAVTQNLLIGTDTDGENHKFKVTVTGSDGTTTTEYTATKDDQQSGESGTTTYTLKKDDASAGTLTVDENTHTFTIVLSKDVLSNASGAFTKLELSYQTQLSKDEIDKWINKNVKETNTVTVSDGTHPKMQVSACVDCNTPVLSKNVTSGYDYRTKQMTYKLTVNSAKMSIANPTIVDTLSSADWAFVMKSDGSGTTLDYTITKDNTDAASDVQSVEITKDTTGKQTVTFKLKNLDSTSANNATYLITYKVQVADTTILNTTKDISIRNTAALSGSPIKTSPTVTTNKSIGGKVLAKTGAQDSQFSRNHQVIWTLKVNGGLAKIPATDGNGHVVVTDVLSDGLDYVGCKIYKGTVSSIGDMSKGEEVTIPADGSPTVNYDDATKTFTASFTETQMEGQAYWIELTTRALNSAKYSNSAYIGSKKDTSSNNESSGSSEAVWGGGTTAIDGTGSIFLEKRKESETGGYLAGATFKLERKVSGKYVQIATFTSKNSADSVKVNETTYKTNASVTGLKYGTYRITEVSAPSGYVRDKNSYEFELNDSTVVYAKTLVNVAGTEEPKDEGSKDGGSKDSGSKGSSDSDDSNNSNDSSDNNSTSEVTITSGEAMKEINSLLHVKDSPDRRSKVARLRTRVKKLLEENPKAFENESAETKDIITNLVENGVLGASRTLPQTGREARGGYVAAGFGMMLAGGVLVVSARRKKKKSWK